MGTSSPSVVSATLCTVSALPRVPLSIPRKLGTLCRRTCKHARQLWAAATYGYGDTFSIYVWQNVSCTRKHQSIEPAGPAWRPCTQNRGPHGGPCDGTSRKGKSRK